MKKNVKKYIKTASFFALLGAFIMQTAGCCSRETEPCASFNLCQFNMRYAVPNDGRILTSKKQSNGEKKETHDGSEVWEKRLPMIKAFLRYNDVDICGTQELSWFQVEAFDDMGEFAYFGTPTYPEKYAQKIPGANNIILYRKNRFDVLQKGDFWFSETPEKVSNSFGANKPRNCNWGKFRDKKTGKIFYFFNMHFHHRGDATRIESAKLLVKKVAEIAKDAPFITTGDLNSAEDKKPIAIIKDSGFMIDARTVCKTPLYGAKWTNNYGYTGKPQNWIDWVFVSKDVEVFKYAVLAEMYDGMWLSDHYPLLLKVGIK